MVLRVSGGLAAPQPNANFPLLATLGSARMRIAFFDRNTSGQNGGASTPERAIFQARVRCRDAGIIEYGMSLFAFVWTDHQPQRAGDHDATSQMRRSNFFTHKQRSPQDTKRWN